MHDQNSIDKNETPAQKYDRALSLFTESVCLLYTSDAADE